MTVFPASGAAGKLGKALTGTVTTTMSPAAAASPLVAADARGPSSAARSASVSGPRELLSTTWCPSSSRGETPPGYSTVQCQLDRTPRVEARRPGVGNRQPFSSHRLAIQFRPLRLQEP